MHIAYSPDTLAIARGLDELLAGLTSSPPSPEFYDQPHDRVRKELDDGGWLNAAIGPEGVLQAVALAEVWGKYLYPVPFLEGMMLRRWDGESSPDLAAGPEVGLGPAGAVLVPFGAPRPEPRPGPLMVTPSFPLAPSSSVPIAVERQRELAPVLAASTVGCATAALVRVSEYAAQREAFGRKIVQFQALRHRIANIMRDIELARTAAVWSAAQDAPDWHAAALKCADLSRSALEGAGQVFGGISFTWEFGLHYYVRHVLAVRRALRSIGAAR
jgi:hypothetical protein